MKGLAGQELLSDFALELDATKAANRANRFADKRPPCLSAGVTGQSAGSGGTLR
jgi:hypothetical protein